MMMLEGLIIAMPLPVYLLTSAWFLLIISISCYLSKGHLKRAVYAFGSCQLTTDNYFAPLYHANSENKVEISNPLYE